MSSSEAACTRRRVKLYTLNDERQWDDKGTGHVSALYTEQDDMALVVISETDGSYLLESKILPDTAYQKQQETLIVWSEGDNTDLALSFQEKVGCDDVWEKICAVQGKDPSVEITQEVVDESDDADDADGYTSTLVQSIQPLALPPCELGHLEETLEMISQAVLVAQKRERLLAVLESTNYLNQLIDLFHKAEDLEDLESLHHLYEIMRQLMLINKHSLYDTLFADDLIMDIVGILEYSPTGRTQHRDFLKNQSAFKEVLPLHNPELVNKIHQTYRVQYIQDCCLPPPCLFDEHTLSQLKSFVSLNKIEIIRALLDDEEFMRCLFTQLRADETDLERRKELSLFVKEFCKISIQTDQKESFLNCLFQHGALRTTEVLLAIDDRDIKSAALEVLHVFVEHHPSVVREYVYKETAPFRTDDELLINIMIDQLLSDPDPELSDAFLLGYILRTLIDPDNMTNPGVRGEKTEFLSFFYKRCIGTLVRPLFDNTAKDVMDKDDYHTALVLNHVLELLTFCIETHPHHMKNYCFNKDLLKRVLVLLQSSHKFLVLASLRLFRRVIHMKEDFYNRYVIKNNLFKPIITLFISNGHRYNLIDSAIVELFDFIRSEDIGFLVSHVIDNYWDILKNVTYVQTFIDLKRAYDRTHRPASAVAAVAAGRPTMMGGSVGQQAALDVRSLVNVHHHHNSLRFQRDPRALEVEEEQWFDQDDDDDEDDVDDDSHLFSHATATNQQPHGSLINGAVVAADGAGSASTHGARCPDSGGNSSLQFESHPLITSPDIVGHAFTGGSSSLASTGADVGEHLFSSSSTSSIAMSLLKPSLTGSNGGGEQGTTPLISSVAANRLLNRSSRPLHTDGDDHDMASSSPPRPQLVRSSTAISIHIKSAFPDLVNPATMTTYQDQSPPLSAEANDRDNTTTGTQVAAELAVTKETTSHEEDHCSTIGGNDDDTEMREIKADASTPPLEHVDHTMDAKQQVPTNRDIPESEGSPKPSKRPRTSFDCVSSPEDVDDDSVANVATDDLAVAEDNKPCKSGVKADMPEPSVCDQEGLAVATGLVDYSDEESDGEDVPAPASTTTAATSAAPSELMTTPNGSSPSTSSPTESGVT